MSQSLKSLIDTVLHQNGTEISNGEVKYFCPFCNHRKQKLQINVNSGDQSKFGRFNCWVCNHKGTVYTLFKTQKASPEQVEKLRSIISRYNSNIVIGDKNNQKDSDHTLYLPEYFSALKDSKNTPEYKNAIHYMTKKRGFSSIDILRHNIGYCESGEYTKKVIIPSYDSTGDLNYFVGRTYYDVEYGKHKNPPVDKNVIGFELYINWDEPIILVEGVADAITVKRNAIPLYGKIISPKLKTTIIKRHVKKIYIALDKDAMREIIPIAEEFMNNGITTYIVNLPEKDPNELGYKRFMELLNETKPLNLIDIVKLKMGV